VISALAGSDLEQFWFLERFFFQDGGNFGLHWRVRFRRLPDL
jgi:hypothetical protein